MPWCKIKNVRYIVGGHSGYSGALTETDSVDTVDRTERALVDRKSVRVVAVAMVIHAVLAEAHRGLVARLVVFLGEWLYIANQCELTVE